MASYDSSVIEEFADRLYREASSTVATYTLLVALLGAGGGVAVGSVIQGALLAASVGALVGGAIGFQIGQQKAFALRLQAQVALCQVQIEVNTRNVARVPPSRL